VLNCGTKPTNISLQIVQFVEVMVMIEEVRLGGGRHAAYIDPPSNIPKGLKMNFVTQPLFMIAITLIKFSIGFFLLKLAVVPTYSHIIKFSMAITLAGNFAYICEYLLPNVLLKGTFTLRCKQAKQRSPVVTFLQCKPLPSAWGEVPGECLPRSKIMFAAYFASGTVVVRISFEFTPNFETVIQIITDFVLALLPIPMIYNLQVNLRTKCAICGILSLGLL
jgi:hypothetical protein